MVYLVSVKITPRDHQMRPSTCYRSEQSIPACSPLQPLMVAIFDLPEDETQMDPFLRQPLSVGIR